MLASEHHVDVDTFRMTMPGMNFLYDNGESIPTLSNTGFEAFIPGEYFMNQTWYVSPAAVCALLVKHIVKALDQRP
jgi:hypothetical protein